MSTYKAIPAPSEESIMRLMTKVDRSPHCWTWLGTKKNGYGILLIAGDAFRAHRVAYDWLVGPLDQTLTIDHLCRVRSCIRPEHLEPVTLEENGRRGLMASMPRRAAIRASRRQQILTPAASRFGPLQERPLLPPEFLGTTAVSTQAFSPQ